MSLAEWPSSIQVDNIMCDLLNTAYEAAIRDIEWRPIGRVIVRC